jgi:hypothetical protein
MKSINALYLVLIATFVIGCAEGEPETKGKSGMPRNGLATLILDGKVVPVTFGALKVTDFKAVEKSCDGSIGIKLHYNGLASTLQFGDIQLRLVRSISDDAGHYFKMDVCDPSNIKSLERAHLRYENANYKDARLITAIVDFVNSSLELQVGGTPVANGTITNWY